MIPLRTTIGIILLSLFCHLTIKAQETDTTDLSAYLQKIEDFVAQERLDHPERFNQELLTKRLSEVTGEERLRTLLELYAFSVYKSTEQARAYNEEAQSLAYRMENAEYQITTIINQGYLSFVQGLFDKSERELLQISNNPKFRPNLNQMAEADHPVLYRSGAWEL